MKSKMEGLHPEASPPSGESTAEPRMTEVRNDLEAGAALVTPVSLRTSAGRARPMVQGEDSEDPLPSFGTHGAALQLPQPQPACLPTSSMMEGLLIVPFPAVGCLLRGFITTWSAQLRTLKSFKHSSQSRLASNLQETYTTACCVS